MTADEFDAETYLDATLPVTGVALDPAWRADVLHHLRVAASMHAALDTSALATDQLVLASVFRVSEVPHE